MACIRSSLRLSNTPKCFFIVNGKQYNLFRLSSSLKSPINILIWIGNARNFSSTTVTSQNETALTQRDVTPLENSHGTGGRSSVSGNTVTVFGATGMVGRILLNRLGKDGTQIIVPYRGDPHDLRPLKLCADLGQMYFQVENHEHLLN